jgi:UDP-N-acetylmuramyl pentapeptide phosphotransferase/UDP-N-acetylglucosamine-1-phosphate transferase
LAQPNARSSHSAPTPQGGGIAVIATTLLVTGGGIAALGETSATAEVFAVLAAGAFIAVVGGIDDLRPLPVVPRLALQTIAIAVALAAMPSDLRLVPLAPWWAERLCVLIAWLWLVNLVNFMDGIDWMTVAEVVPVTGAIVLLGLAGAVEPLPALLAAALVGAMIGFAPFNRPVAQVFLGDVGSLPIGLLLGWLLVQLAAMGHVAAALILPLYYLADATITLAGRVVRGEPFWRAHRTHFYQRATDCGLTVREIVTRVFVANLALAALALITVAAHNLVVSFAMLAASAVIILWLLAAFSGVMKRR